jgi:hypothetical protein
MNNPTFSAVFTIAYTCHMLPDQLLNNTKPFGYFMTYRIMKKFEMKKFFYPHAGKPESNLEIMNQKKSET